MLENFCKSNVLGLLINNATQLQVDATQLQVDATQLQVDATQLQVDATQLQVDATQLQVDATQLQVDATQLQSSSPVGCVMPQANAPTEIFGALGLGRVFKLFV